MKRLLFFLMLLLLIGSCDLTKDIINKQRERQAQRRLLKIQKKFPDFFQRQLDTIYQDTLIYTRDTLYIKELNLKKEFLLDSLADGQDTTFTIQDTATDARTNVTIKREGTQAIVQVKTYVPPKILYLHDTIKIEIPIVKEKIITKPIIKYKYRMPWWWKWVIGIVVGVLLLRRAINYFFSLTKI